MTRDEVLQRIAERINEYLPETSRDYYRGYHDALSWVEDLLTEGEQLDGLAGDSDG